MGKEPKEPVSARAVFREGEAARLLLESGDVKAEVCGDVCQRAQKQPATEESAARQLGKTGGTPFAMQDRLSVDLEGELFLPVQALNKLRRDGLEALQEAMVSRWRRETDGAEPVSAAGGSAEEPGHAAGGGAAEPRHAAGTAAAEGRTASASGPKLTISLEEAWQLAPALDAAQASRIYLDAGGFAPETWADRVRDCRRAGKECWLMLPHIFRSREEAYFARSWQQLLDAGFDGILAKNWRRLCGLESRGSAFLWALIPRSTAGTALQ